jgi:hypothetical protein
LSVPSRNLISPWLGTGVFPPEQNLGHLDSRERGIEEGNYLQARSAWQADENKPQRVALREERLLCITAGEYFGERPTVEVAMNRYSTKR